MYFELDNDDMESSKRRSLFISLIFVLKLFTSLQLSKGVDSACHVYVRGQNEIYILSLVSERRGKFSNEELLQYH